jgi:hypothetical protein
MGIISQINKASVSKMLLVIFFHSFIKPWWVQSVCRTSAVHNFSVYLGNENNFPLLASCVCEIVHVWLCACVNVWVTVYVCAMSMCERGLCECVWLYEWLSMSVWVFGCMHVCVSVFVCSVWVRTCVWMWMTVCGWLCVSVCGHSFLCIPQAWYFPPWDALNESEHHQECSKKCLLLLGRTFDYSVHKSFLYVCYACQITKGMEKQDFLLLAIFLGRQVLSPVY